MTVLYIIIGVVVVLILYVLVTYNRFVVLKNSVKEAFSTMDVYLKKRWDLIPNILESVKGYMTHERETLESIVSLRSGSYDNMTPEDKIDANDQLSKGLSKLFALAENYPDLKANQNFMDLNNQLSLVEEDIANARKYYNAVAKNMNNAIMVFPSNIIANMFGYKEEKMFEVQEAEREAVKVKF
ncbi:MAG TPA: LemA family protein [Bacilli bacterium]|nr:LemA family protein [Bacilli bacterium]